MIIGLSGYAKSGKDTVAEMIQAIEPMQWEIKKFSGKLKQIASLLTAIPIEKFEDQEFKMSELSHEWDYLVPSYGYMDMQAMTVREFLQRLGTDAVRDGLHPNAWVNALFADYNPIRPDRLPYTHPNWVVTDVRFPNEAKSIKERGGIIVRVHRPEIKPVNPHVSEIALDKWAFDYIITNDSDLDYLKESVQNFLKNKIND